MERIEKRIGLTRVVGMEKQEGLYETSVKPIPVEICHVTQTKYSDLRHYSLRHVSKKMLESTLPI